MSHRAEQIMTAALTVASGLATTGANVERGRVYAWPAETAAALAVYQGGDLPVDDELQPWDIVDSWLEIRFEAHVKSAADQIDTQLNQIRRELTVALQADPTLGLAFVHELAEGETAEPLIEAGDKPTAVMRMSWRVKYRRTRSDPGA